MFGAFLPSLPGWCRNAEIQHSRSKRDRMAAPTPRRPSLEDGPGFSTSVGPNNNPGLVHLRGPSEADDGRGGASISQLMSVWTTPRNMCNPESSCARRQRSLLVLRTFVGSQSSGRRGLAMCLPQSSLHEDTNKRSRWLQMRGSRERKLQTDKKTARGGKAIENTNTMRITECGGPSRPSLQQRAPSRCDPLT